MTGSQPGPDAQIQATPGGGTVAVDPVTDLTGYHLPADSPGGQLLAGPRAAWLNPPLPVKTAPMTVLPPPAGQPGRLVKMPGGRMGITPSGLVAAAPVLTAIPRPAPDRIDYDPPLGSQVIQSMPDGSMVVLPLPAAYNGDDAGTINAALLQLRAGINVQAQAWAGGKLHLAAATYTVQSTISLGISQILEGAGPQTRLNFTGAGDCIRWWDPYGPGASGGQSGFGSYQTHAGAIRDLVIDLTQCTTGAQVNGIHLGDGWGHEIRHVRVENRNHSNTCCALYFDNNKFWCEKGHFQITNWGCNLGIIFDVNGGTGSGPGQESYEFNEFDFDVFLWAGSNGVTFQNGAYLSKGSLILKGNFITTNGIAGGAALIINGSDAGSGIFSHINHSHVELRPETDGGGALTPTTVAITVGNTFQDCEGILAFDDPWTASTVATAQFSKFGGPIIGDANLATLNATPNPLPTGWPH